MSPLEQGMREVLDRWAGRLARAEIVALTSDERGQVDVVRVRIEGITPVTLKAGDSMDLTVRIEAVP